MHHAYKESEFLTSDGHLTDQSVALFAEALHYSCTELLPEEVLVHIEDCLECKAAVMDTSEIIKNDDLPRIEDHPFFSRSQYNNVLSKKNRQIDKKTGKNYFFFKIAAGVLIVSAISVLLMVVLKNTGLQPPAISRQDTSSNLIKENKTVQKRDNIVVSDKVPVKGLYVEAFSPNQSLENMVKGQTRVSGFKMISPAPGRNFKSGSGIVFKWESKDDSDFLIRILDNKGKLKFEKNTTAKTQNVSSLTQKGLYYWFISSSDDMIAGGFFTIGK